MSLGLRPRVKPLLRCYYLFIYIVSSCFYQLSPSWSILICFHVTNATNHEISVNPVTLVRQLLSSLKSNHHEESRWVVVSCFIFQLNKQYHKSTISSWQFKFLLMAKFNGLCLKHPYRCSISSFIAKTKGISIHRHLPRYQLFTCIIIQHHSWDILLHKFSRILTHLVPIFDIIIPANFDGCNSHINISSSLLACWNSAGAVCWYKDFIILFQMTPP